MLKFKARHLAHHLVVVQHVPMRLNLQDIHVQAAQILAVFHVHAIVKFDILQQKRKIMKIYYLFIGSVIGILLITMGIKLYYQHNSNIQDVQIQNVQIQASNTTQHHKVSCKAAHNEASFICSHIN